MKLYRQYHSIGGQQLRGRFTSRSCRNYCQKTVCWAVDYNGASHTCYLHRKPKRRRPATAKSTGTKFYWKVGQYAKRRFTPPAHFHLKRYTHRRGNCPGHTIHVIRRTNLRHCANWCNKHAVCRSFLYVAKGSNSYCRLKRHAKACTGKLRNRKHKRFHFYNKKAPRRVNIHFGKLLRPQLKVGGIVHLKWFRNLKKCMWGTKRVGKTCRIVNYLRFIRWLRRHHKRYHINLALFPRIFRMHYTYVFKRGPVPRKYRLHLHPGVTYVRIPKKKPKVFAIHFPGKKGAYATGPRFNKYRGSFTIALYIKPRTVSRNQVLIGNWAPNRWQYLFRIWKGGNLGLYLRGPSAGGDIVPELRGGKVVPNRWSHVGFSWNRRSGVARIYLNGKVVATKKTNIKYPQRHLFKSPYPRFQLGYKMDSNSDNFNGLMARLQLFRGIVPVRVFRRFTKFIKNNKLNFGGFPKKIFKLLLKHVRPGGIIHLSWFKRKHCFPGTKKVGKTCKIRRIRVFLKWLKRVAPKYHINIGKLPMNKIWPLQPAGKIFGHPWYLLFKQPRPKSSKGIKKGKGPFGSRLPGYYFPGKPNAYFKIPNKGHLHFKSFTIFAWIKQNGIRNGPIVEYAGHKGVHFGTHFWIWGNTLFVNVVHNHGKMFGVHFPKFKGMFPRNKWAFVGVSYNHKNGHILLWINGRTYFKKGPIGTPDTVGPVYVGIRPKGPREYPFKGYISGVSILPFAVTRKNVRKFSRYYITLIGGKAPAGFFKAPGKPKPKPHKPYSLKPAGKIFKHHYYNCFGFVQKKHNPSKSAGPYHSKLPGFYFPGKPNIYFRVPSGGKLHFKSITIFTFIKQKSLHDGAILEWEGSKKMPFGTHFWIWQKKLFVNLRHNNGKSLGVFFNLKGGLPTGKWNFVGMSYDHNTGVLMMWINGNIFTKKVGKFTLDTIGDAYVGVRPKNKKFSPFKGYLSGVTLLPFAISPAQIAPFRVVIMRRIYHIKQLPKGFWWKVGYKPKPKPAPEKPKAPTKLTKENLRPGGTFDLRSVFKGLDICPEGSKSKGTYCVISNYKVFIAWLKVHAAAYHIVFKSLPVYTTTTTTTTQQFSAGQKFPAAMFRNVCPKGTKAVGKFCEVTNVDEFMGWLKVNAKAYNIEYSYTEGGNGGGGGGGGGYSTKTETTTTTSGGGFASGQKFPKDMFGGSCPSGTATKGNECSVTNVDKFIAWLKVNAAKYNISFSTSRK